MKGKPSIIEYQQITTQKHGFLTRCECGGTVDLDNFTLIQFCHTCGSMWTYSGTPIPGDFFKTNQCYLTIQEKE